jgi:hypothetical protein
MPKTHAPLRCAAIGSTLLALILPLPLAARTMAAPPADSARRAIITDPFAVFTVPQVNKPWYLFPFADPTFGTYVERMTGDLSHTTAPVIGTWGSDARHVYSRQQPWNSDNSMLIIENWSPGSPTPLILDGTTFAPKLGPCSNYLLWDYRWHPSTLHPHELINVDSSGTELAWFDVTTCTKTRSWTLPITVDYGIGSAKGNPSQDGRLVALNNNSAMFVVDMDPQPPYPPYPSVRMGPVYTFPPCSLTTDAPNVWTIDNISISPSGKYVDVKFGSGNDTTLDANRIYEVDPATLALKPHNMAGNSLRCGSFQYRPNGWIFPLKHADIGVDPFDNNEDVLVGGRSCPGSTIGQVVKVRLRDGAVTPLTDGVNESYVYHVSMRNVNRPGWAYVSWYKVDGTRFSDEITAIKLDGSQSVERYCHMHSLTTNCYRCEAHPVPSRDGQRILFASNWAEDCGYGCGSAADIKDYVVGSFTWPVYGVGESEPLTIQRVWPNPARDAAEVDYWLAGPESAVIELADLSGRTVERLELGAPGRGSYHTRLQFPGIRPGTYWIRVIQAGRATASRVVFLR